MKLLEDYTNSELVDLGDDALNQLFALECASRNVPLPSSLVEPPTKPEDRDDLKPDITLYRVGDSYGDKYYFNTAEDAQIVADAMNSRHVNARSTYQNSTSIVIRQDGDAELVSVTPVPSYSVEHWSKVQSEFKAWKSKEAEYNRIISENSKLRSQHDGIWDDIYSAISKAKIEFSDAQSMANQLAEYRKLSDGNETIARNFLINAHREKLEAMSDEALQKVGISRGELNGTENMPAEQG